MNPLEQAAELIERVGWCRDRFFDEEGRICLDFALLCVDPTGSEQARECVRAELASRGVTAAVVDWNDAAPDATAVVELLRAAAARWTARPRSRPVPRLGRRCARRAGYGSEGGAGGGFSSSPRWRATRRSRTCDAG